MIIPELKGLSYISDPDEHDNCCVNVVVRIGELGKGDAADDFHFVVVTPKYISLNWPHWGRHTLVVEHFSILLIERTVGALLEGKNGISWEKIANELHSYMAWEFHDYYP
ncbi:hypothetical protein BH09PAT4_BH09PAT4_09150 [soil metagenome]